MNPYTITEVDLQNLSEEQFVQMHEHASAMRSEVLPDDPPVTLNELVQNFKNIPPFVRLRRWHVCPTGSDQIIATADLVWLLTEENQHLAQIDIEVLPDHRRQGLGKRLLGLLVEGAQAVNRRLFITNTNSRIPAAAVFLEKMGGQRGLETHTNQLDMQELNHDLLETWLRQAPERAPGYSLGFWDGPYPEERLAEIAELHEVGNDQPIGDLEVEDQHTTPEMLRQMEQSLFATGRQRWTYYASENSSGNLVGYTEISWHPSRAHIRGQGITGVVPAHRNRGLGRWLKAAMLERLLKEEPPVRFIRTGNANENAPMLKINHALGFKPYYANTLWQIPVETAAAYVQAANGE